METDFWLYEQTQKYLGNTQALIVLQEEWERRKLEITKRHSEEATTARLESELRYMEQANQLADQMDQLRQKAGVQVIPVRLALTDDLQSLRDRLSAIPTDIEGRYTLAENIGSILERVKTLPDEVPGKYLMTSNLEQLRQEISLVPTEMTGSYTMQSNLATVIAKAQRIPTEIEAQYRITDDLQSLRDRLRVLPTDIEGRYRLSENISSLLERVKALPDEVQGKYLMTSNLEQLRQDISLVPTEMTASLTIQSNLEQVITQAKQLPQYLAMAAPLTDEEALDRRYERERDILNIQEQILLAKDKSLMTDAEAKQYGFDYLMLTEKRNGLETTLAYNLLDLQIEKLQKINELKGQERDLSLQNYEATWQKIMDLSNQIGGDMGQGIGTIGAGLKGMFDIEVGTDPYSRQLDQYQKMLSKKLEAVTGYHMQERMLMEAQTQYGLDWESLTYQQKQGLYQGFMDQMISITNLSEDTKKQIIGASNEYIAGQDSLLAQQRIYNNQMAMTTIMGILNTAGSIIGKNNMLLFLGQKAAAVAITLINSHAAAMAALAPPPLGLGPVLGIPLAAKMETLGYIQAAAIAATSIGQAASGGSNVGTSGGGYSYTQPTVPSYQQTAAATETKTAPVINIVVNGSVMTEDELGRIIVPALQKAYSDNMH
jgi:hypothetical protein